MIAFRDWWKRDWPGDEDFARGIERLLADENTDYLLGAITDDGPAAGVCGLRYRYGVWLDGLDCCLEDVFVEDAARGKTPRRGAGARRRSSGRASAAAAASSWT